MKHKKIILSISALLILIIASGAYLTIRTKTQMKELFRMNKELQEEGYYMAEFEFKMLGFAYYLDKGNYHTALSRISKYHHELMTKQGLIKMPEFKNKEEEMQFYLNLQNPKTGAFMNDSFPYCTYTGPTGNVLGHLDALAKELGKPLKLKYPLKYLDEINTPEKLKAYLDDVGTVGWIASKFPQTTFHNARDILSLFNEENAVERNKLFNVTPELKKAVIKWFYDNQDPETGLWGPKSKSGKLMKKDVMNSTTILKVFVNKNGENIYESFPLRYKDKLAQTILEDMYEPTPQDDELDDWHEWNLKTSKSIKVLIGYLWNDISKENKEKTRDFIKQYLTIRFEKFYVPKEGAFAYYPHGEHATLDGTGEFLMFNKIGAFSVENQTKLWGAPNENITDLGIKKINDLKKSDFDLILNSKSLNSLRIYKTDPVYGNLTSGVLAVVYPKKATVLDVMDVTPKVKHWLKTTDLTMGNWTSKEDIIQELDTVQIDEVPVYENDIPLESANQILKNNGKLVVIGFDSLQIPRYKIVYGCLPNITNNAVQIKPERHCTALLRN